MALALRALAAVGPICVLTLLVGCGGEESSTAGGASSQPPLVDIDERMVIHLDLDRWHAGFVHSRLRKCWGDPAIQAWFRPRWAELCALIQRRWGFDPRGLGPAMRGELLVALTYDPLLPAENRWFKATLAVRQPGGIDTSLRTLEESFAPVEWEKFRRRLLRVGDVLALSLGDPRRTTEIATRFQTGVTGFGISSSGDPFLQIVGRGLDLKSDPGGSSPERRALLHSLGLLSLVDHRVGVSFDSGSLAMERVTDIGAGEMLHSRMVGPSRRFSGLRRLPAGTVAALHTSTVPTPELCEFMTEFILGALPAEGRARVDQGLADLSQTTGLGLCEEVAASLGEEWAFVFGGMRGLSLDAAVMVEARNPQILKRFIRGVIEQIDDGLASRVGAAPTPGTSVLQLVPVTVGTRTFEMVVVPGLPLQICHGFLEDRLVIATSLGQMNDLVQAASGAGATLADTPVWARLGPDFQEPAGVAWFVDFDRLGGILSQTVLPVAVPNSPAAANVLRELRVVFPLFTDHLGLLRSTSRATGSRRTVRTVSETGGEIALLGMISLLVAIEELCAEEAIGVARTS